MDVALVGIGCRLPGGADTPAAFWELLSAGTDAITEVPPERFDAHALFDPDPSTPGKLTSRWGGFVGPLDAFDADFFGISPREAQRVEPQQRLLLEVTWEALEDGGQAADRLAGSDTGVFVGVSTHDYGDLQRSPAQRDLIDAYVGTGSALSILANRISYALDLHGPSLVVDTACSSSLTATHLACRSLAAGECDLAVAGGVNVILTPESTVMFSKASMLAPDGRCKPFDARADGYVRSEGAGAVVLKPLDQALADRDPIYAVIRATAINEDGRTSGITVPSADAQAALLRRALRDAGIAPHEVQYVEAHGTGTAVGDPQEGRAIGAVYGAGRPVERPCLMGSVKGNLGHLEAAAGITGLIKGALVLTHRRIPPSLHHERGNPAVDFDGLRLRVPTRPEPWPDAQGAALAAVNAFGFGGANAHALLAEPPARAAPPPDDESTSRVLALSARSPDALRALARSWTGPLTDPDGPTLRDCCHTAGLRRSHHPHRLAVVAATRTAAVDRLEAFLADEPDPGVATGRATGPPGPGLAFVFSGMGPQWAGMGRTLLREEPAFREAVAACDEVLAPLAGWSVAEALTADDVGRLAAADRSHVANLALQLGLTALWRSWGVVPDAVAGHSSGETAAACVAGALPLADAIRLAHHRGSLLHTRTDAGGMLAAAVPPEIAEQLVADHAGRACVAAVNGPASVTFSGEVSALAQIAAELDAQGRWHRELTVRIPYHSPQLAGIEPALRASLEGLTCHPTRIPMVSTTTGDWADGGSLTPGHWWRNLRQPVRFRDAVDRLVDGGCTLFIEVGAHPVLAQSVLECLAAGDHDGAAVPSLRRNEDERQTLLRSLAALHTRGREVDWPAVLGGEGAPVRLPTYPWQRERHWLDAGPDAHSTPHRAAGTAETHPLLGTRLDVAQPTWELALADAGLAYLDDHLVRGTPALPGAAYVAMGLAAGVAATEASVGLHDVAFHSLMSLGDRDGAVVQSVVDQQAGAVAFHSRRDADAGSWTLRASTRLAEPGTTEAPFDLDACRARCPEPVPVERFYRVAGQRYGLTYGGAFRGLTEIRVGGDEALARVAVPEGAELDAEQAPVHPALLDAAFQALLAPLVAADHAPHAEGGVVLVGIDRVTWHGRPGAAFWSHAMLRRQPGGAIAGDVRLLDDAGHVALTCRGLRLQTLEGGGADIGSLLREEVWEPAPRPASDPPDPTAIARTVDGQLGSLAAQAGFDDYYTVVEPGLNALACRLARAALTELGWHPDADPSGLAERLGVAPRHHQHLARLLELLATAEPADLGEHDLGDRDDVRPGLDLVRESGLRLAATLRGDEDPRGWLLAGAASPALAAFYTATPSGRFYNRAVAEAVAAAKPAGRGLRILEVGAGTGATTAALLERMGDEVEAYHLTDVSPFFVKHARQRFGDRPEMTFAVLDLEQPAADAQPSFDVVVAADVIHATADVDATLRRLQRHLTPGGLAVLLEPVRRSPWLELIFGQVEGWWGFTDTALRPSHPLLAVPAWEAALASAGYTDVASLADAPADDGEPMQVVLLAGTPAATQKPAEGSARARWLVLADRQGIGAQVAATLRARGDHCTLVRPGAAHRRDQEHVELAPTDETQWAQLLREAAGHGGAPLGLVHCWSLDAPASPASTASLMAAQDLVCGGLVSLLRAAHDADVPLGEVWLVTAGAQPARPVDGPPAVTQAPLWGLGRVLRNERGGQLCRLVDLGRPHDPADVRALLREVTTPPGPDPAEPELALRRGQRLARRLRQPALGPVPRRRRRRSPDAEPFRLDVGSAGALDSLRLVDAGPVEPHGGEVAIQVRAASLNFRDVLVALGVMPDSERRRRLGLDLAGVVMSCEGSDAFQPGDEVLAIGQGTLASQVATRADLCAPKPEGLGFAAAAALPTAFVTAHSSLHDMGRLAPGERVLVHTASGGVGLAAVQVARQVGAEVLATAGTPEKRAFLASAGIAHVMDSRSLTFADEVREVTAGAGVDVVVNTLIGQARVESLALLAPGGRFIDLSVRDFATDALELAPFTRGLSFHTFGDPTEPFPSRWGSILRTVVDEVTAGHIEALPCTTFDLTEAGAAFRLLAQARHIGKVVLSVDEPHYWVEEPPPPLLTAEGTYLLVGGLGGLGIALAQWMVQQGARHLVLTNRQGTPRPEDRQALEDLEASAASVVTAAVDAADQDATHALLARVRATQPPLRGVVHAAMVLDDEWLGRLDPGRLRAVLAPKVAGAWSLHELTLDDELDLFVCFSSASSLIGPPTQGGYAAANAFLDALATHRRALGLPALTVGWGAISGVGHVARHPELWEVTARVGVDAITPQEAFLALETALRQPVARLAIGRIDWAPWARGRAPDPRARGTRSAGGQPDPGGNDARAATVDLSAVPRDQQATVIEQHVARRAAKVLDSAADRIDPSSPLTDMGLDSLMAVELQTMLQRDFGVEIPLVDVLDHATVRGLATRIATGAVDAPVG